jgi:predicted ATPase
MCALRMRYFFRRVKSMEHSSPLPHYPSPEIVVVSGGPCGGKTTLIEELPTLAAAAGRDLAVMPEIASQLITEGVDFGDLAQNNRPAYLEAQRCIIARELDFIANAHHAYAGSNTLVIMDRGINDTFAYMTPDEAVQLASEYDKVPHDFYELVDRVVYMPSIAVRDPRAYEQLKATNTARYETAQQAAATCLRTVAQWAGHPELCIVDEPDFETKLRRAGQLCLGTVMPLYG